MASTRRESVLLQAETLNNRGVQCMKHGNLNMATRFLRRALSLMMQEEVTSDVAVSVQPQDMQVDASTSSPLSKAVSDTRTRNALRSATFNIAWSWGASRQQQTALVEDGLIAMYESAFLIFSSEIDEQSMTAALLFNLALISHCRAVYLGKSKQLRTSLQLYEMILDIVQFQADESTYTRRFDNLLVLATFNNCAHINSQQFHHAEAKFYFNSLRQAICMTPSQHQHQQQPSTEVLSEDDYSFFILNAMCLHGEEIKVAPAA